ncbi:unnamed protein product, partial [Rotaria magnacalcarata]
MLPDQDQNHQADVHVTGGRRACRYGRDCFRKDADHRAGFAHP